MSFEPPLPPYNASDPLATFLNTSCLDLLLIEMVPMGFRLAHELSVGQQQQAGKDGVVKAAVVDEDAEEAQRTMAFRRLEELGYRVGQGLVERFSRDRARFMDTLDMIKFLCKDMWTLVFRKQIDNLKTNHRGTYVLTDGSFRPFARMSATSSSEAVVRAQPFLWFPCGIIRGALSSMGINATVQAETPELPAATFHIKTVVTKP